MNVIFVGMILGCISLEENTPKDSLSLPFQRTNVRSVSFEAQVYYESPPETPNDLQLGQYFLVKASRNGRVRVEANLSPLLKPEMSWAGNPFNLYVSNGNTQCEVARETKEYEISQSVDDLSQLKSRRGLPEEINLTTILSSHPLSNFVFDGEEAKNSQKLFRFVKKGDAPTVRTLLFIIPATRLPTRYSRFIKDGQGKLSEVLRVEFSEWKINPTIDASTFSVRPPQGAKDISVKTHPKTKNK